MIIVQQYVGTFILDRWAVTFEAAQKTPVLNVTTNQNADYQLRIMRYTAECSRT